MSWFLFSLVYFFVTLAVTVWFAKLITTGEDDEQS